MSETNLLRLLERLETTKIPKITGQLRDKNGCMCALGHAVDIWIADEVVPDAEWLVIPPEEEDAEEDAEFNYFRDEKGDRAGLPTDSVMDHFGLTSDLVDKIWRWNDRNAAEPLADIAARIRAELNL